MDKCEKALNDLERGFPGGNALAVAIECIKKNIGYDPVIVYKLPTKCTFGKCKCGMSVNSDMKYCDECGQKLNWRLEDD